MKQAILINKDDDGYNVKIGTISIADLPEGNVTVRVLYSTLNYKDALAITGKAPVVRKFPMVPGIDFVGEVEQSEDSRFKSGDMVILNGWGVGETHWGGLSQIARVSADWLIHLPKEISPLQSMAIGTAGYTAMLCVMALERNDVTPDKGEVLVTGAAGGVGSVAISLLSKLGYEVAGSTGRPEEAEYLHQLGCKTIVERNTLNEAGRPLTKERWAGAIDTLGSHTLANVCAAMKYHGVVAACGLAQGMDFPATMAPFILRAVTLVGIDSVNCPLDQRQKAWERLAQDLDMQKLELIGSRVISLKDSLEVANQLIEGKVRGRVVVDLTN